MHDATEAYLADIARPVKHTLGFGEVYRECEARLWSTIAGKWDLPDPISDEVHAVDDLILANEIRFLMPEHEVYGTWYDTKTYPPMPRGFFDPWSTNYAENSFLWRYHELTGTRESATL